MTGHSARAGRALQSLAETDPALAALSLCCDHRDGDATRSSGVVITYGPDFTARPLHEQIALAAHHILHVALRHSARMQALATRFGPGFDAALFNLAADALVNEALLLSTYALPRPAVTATELIGATTGKQMPPQQLLAEWDVERLYHCLMRPDAGKGGGGQTARAYARSRSFDPDLDPESGDADAEGDVEAAARWRQHLTRALDAGRAAGRGIGLIGHRIADIPTPRTPWEVILRHFLTRAALAQPQPSHRRPSRRWIAGAAQALAADTPTPGFEPGQRPLTDVPRVVLALDASGSIDDTRLALFWGEITGVALRCRAELHLLVFDDTVRLHMKIDPLQAEMPRPDMPRGGGTAFAPVIAAAQALRPSALVVLTDLDGDPGPPPRALPVLWAVPDGTPPAPSFGKVITLTA